MTDPTPSFENTSVTAILARRSRADRSALLDELAAMLTEVMPDLRVERSLLRRRVTAIRLPVADFVYVLKKKGSSDAFETIREQEVRGVVIRTTPMEIDAFLAELGAALDEELRRTERGRRALDAWLNSSNP